MSGSVPTLTAQAWINAEQQLVVKILTFLAGAGISGVVWKLGQNIFIGDASDLAGRINLVVVQIEGGMLQDQAMGEGAATWHTTARVAGVFDDRVKALAVGSVFLDAANVPFDGGPDVPALKNISHVYIRTHPKVSRKPHPLMNVENVLIGTFVDVELGIVYTSEVTYE